MSRSNKKIAQSIKDKSASFWGGFKRHWLDIITLGGVIVGLFMLVALIYYNVVPVKLADIKVPVATDKSSYYAGQSVSAIFFGQTFYDGEFKVLREVFCSNYRGIITPPDAVKTPDNYYQAAGKPRMLNGETLVIGDLPMDVPIGSNCIIRFTNIYDIQTPFGVRHEKYQYYTQNFAIISKERREQLDCEATGKSTSECQELLSPSETTNKTADSMFGGGSFAGGGASGDTNTITNNTTNNTTNNNTTTPPSEPVTPPQECTVNLLGIKLFCN